MADQNTRIRDIQHIIDSVRTRHPEIAIEQLQVLHPGVDDDGLWFFTKPTSPISIQLESTSGNCPFIIETDANNVVLTATSVEQAIEMIESLMFSDAVEPRS
jgi:hypothetical protein